MKNHEPPRDTSLRPPHSPAWRWVRRLVLTIIMPLTLVALFYAVENSRGALAWRRIEAQLVASGRSTHLSRLAPPPVSEAENFAEAPLFARAMTFQRDPQTREWRNFDSAAANRLRTVTNVRQNSSVREPKANAWWRGESLDLEAWQEYYRMLSATESMAHGPTPVRPQDHSIPMDLAQRYGLTNSQPNPDEFQRLFVFPVTANDGTPAAAVLTALEKVGVELDGLAVEAERRPRTRFPLHYDLEPAAGILLPHLATLKRLSLVLQLRASARLASGNSEGALQDVRLSMRIAEMPAGEPFLISHMVRAADWMILLQPVWEGLQTHRWTEPQLEELSQHMGQADMLSGAAIIYLAEGLLFAAAPTPEVRQQLADLLPTHPEQSSDDPARLELKRRLVLHAPRGWFHQNGARHFQRTQQEYEHLRNWMDSPAMTNFTLSPSAPPSMQLLPYELIMGVDSITAYRRGFSKLVRAEAYRRLAVTACALERYRLANRSYPESLAALVPRYLQRPPLDPMDGAAMKYQRVDDRTIRLYSVGPDARDNGGRIESKPPSEDVSMADLPEARLGQDWVWPTALLGGADGFQ